jgi:hypothetical protein
MMFDERLLLASTRDGGQIVTSDVAIADVLCVEIGQSLLFSWMTIVSGKTSFEEIKIPFNTVKADLFIDALSLLRLELDSRPLDNDKSHLVTPELDLKFKNALHHWLTPEEVVLKLAFQPEVRSRRFLAFERQIMPPVLAALTTRQFLLITEEPPVAREQLGTFTEVYTYCPHSKIESVAVETGEKEEGIAELHVTLANRNARFSVRSRVSTDLAPPFITLRDAVNDFITKNRLANDRVFVNA